MDERYLQELRRIARWTKQLTISQYVLMLALILHGLIVKAFIK